MLTRIRLITEMKADAVSPDIWIGGQACSGQSSCFEENCVQGKLKMCFEFLPEDLLLPNFSQLFPVGYNMCMISTQD